MTVPRSLEFQYGATLADDADGDQVSVVTDQYYGQAYVYPGPLSGPLPVDVTNPRG